MMPDAEWHRPRPVGFARRVSALLCGLWTLHAAAAWALPPDSWVLAIGNNRGDANEIELLYAEDDARTMAEVLNGMGGVPSARITTMVGAKADAVRTTLAQVSARIAARGAGGPSALVVYYSGHSDASALHLDGTRLPLDELVALVKGSAAKTRLLVLDACRSGGASRVKGVQATNAFDLSFVQASAVEGMAIITSSTAREASLESDRLRGSFFTHFFVGGLRGAADRDGNGQVTLSEVYDYAYGETVRASGRTTSVQHPTFAMDMKGKGAVVLSRTDPGRALGRIALPDTSLYLISEGVDGRLVSEVKPSRDNVTVALPARQYTVQRRAATEYRSYAVRLRAGRTVALDDVPFKSVKYDRLVRKRGGDTAFVHGLSVLGGARSELIPGEGVTPALSVGYGLDFPWFTTHLRLRLERATDAGVDLPRTRTAASLGLGLERFTDLSWASIAFGLRVDGGWYRQAFDTPRAIDETTTFGLTFSGVLALERPLFGGLSLRVETGPATTLLPLGKVESGAPTTTDLDARLVYWGNLGVVWRL